MRQVSWANRPYSRRRSRSTVGTKPYLCVFSSSPTDCPIVLTRPVKDAYRLPAAVCWAEVEPGIVVGLKIAAAPVMMGSPVTAPKEIVGITELPTDWAYKLT